MRDRSRLSSWRGAQIAAGFGGQGGSLGAPGPWTDRKDTATTRSGKAGPHLSGLAREASHEPTLSIFRQGLGLLQASVELVAQLLGIERRANGDNLRARRASAPFVEFEYLGATSDYL